MIRRTRAAFFNCSVNRLSVAAPKKVAKFNLVRIHSFDHDGCVGTPFLDPCDVPGMHIDLLDHLKANQLQFPALECMMIFSNRQSLKKDCKNALFNNNNLALQVIPALAKKYNVYFDPLLLTDISLNQKPGTTYCKLIESAQKMQIKLNDKISPKELEQLAALVPIDYVYSTDKVNILYAQAHRAACFFPQSRIELNVYDDLSKAVLTPCYEFYKCYPELLPENVVVNFTQYDTVIEELPKPQLLYSIRGSGKLNPLYYQTIKKMEDRALAEEGEHLSEYTFSNYLSPTTLFEGEPLITASSTKL
ncbi:hypothetical protein ACD661_15170 [Legionella lytica]|uniref:Dot/Icm T4SS effector n=1 Tax=Legionella lytica TaxID=96232 RepID=A0ABW8DB09_9GAMM